jgi:hypothetical protein
MQWFLAHKSSEKLIFFTWTKFIVQEYDRNKKNGTILKDNIS